jgi:quinol monooxygenase YgiN
MLNHRALATIGIVSLAISSNSVAAPKEGKSMNHPGKSQIAREATFIPVTAAKGKETAVAGLLKGAADLVKKTEPLTLQWLALQEDPSKFVIVDFFHEAKGRDAHFAGKVAAALKEASGEALEGGWEKGVVAHVENSKVLSYTVTTNHAPKAALAVRIEVRAKAGKEEALATFLAGAGDLVKATEPGTLLWYAIRISNDRFAIFDIFGDAEANAAHFGGKVAAALKANADELLQGGWDKGVVANIKSYQVLSSTY